MCKYCSYLAPIEKELETIEYLLTQDYRLSQTGQGYQISKRNVALLLLQRDPVFLQEVQRKEPLYHEIEHVIKATQTHFEEPLIFVISQARHRLGM